MPHSNETNDLLDAIAKILLRCFVLGYLFLLLWFCIYMFAGDMMYRLNRSLFGVTPHEMNLLHLFGMALVKLILFLFFLFPYIAIRWILRNRAA
jgi:hypothetical protein